LRTPAPIAVISIADQGKGLDPDSLPDPLAPENLLRGTGRGIFLIRSFMDEVHFRQLHPGTELTLVKTWRRLPKKPEVLAQRSRAADGKHLPAGEFGQTGFLPLPAKVL
jgi:hypothetical protein